MNREIVDAAGGKIPCDSNFVHCTLIDVLSGCIVQNATISVKNGYVVGVNDGFSARQTIDLEGLYLAPGLVDAHVHIESSLLTPSEYARVVLPHGTTTVIADPHEIANVMGYDGMRYMLNSSQNIPLDMFSWCHPVYRQQTLIPQEPHSMRPICINSCKSHVCWD